MSSADPIRSFIDITRHHVDDDVPVLRLAVEFDNVSSSIRHFNASLGQVKCLNAVCMRPVLVTRDDAVIEHAVSWDPDALAVEKIAHALVAATLCFEHPFEMGAFRRWWDRP